MKKTHKKTQKTRSYARSIASNFWVLWQPPIGNVTPYFRGFVPYVCAKGLAKATVACELLTLVRRVGALDAPAADTQFR